MRVYFILDNDVLFLPKMLDAILCDNKHEWIGIGITSNDVTQRYMRRHIRLIGIWSAMKLLSKQYIALFIDKLRPKKPRTIQSVARAYGVPWRIVKNVNDPEYLDFLTHLKPDVIVSSNEQIFRKEILSIPTVACINRHSSLLPANRGMLAVFHAIANGDAYTGVSIHFMNEKIDDGGVIVQRAVYIPPLPNLFKLYKKCFEISPEIIKEALDILEKKLPFKTLKDLPITSSYHSLPNDEDWKKFKARGAKFA